MQKDIYKETYFGTLMSILVDECRKILPSFNPTERLHKIQNDMCRAGTYTDKISLDTIIHTEPQRWIKDIEQGCMPEYRRLAANLIDGFVDEFEAQSGNRREITEHLERMYKWKQ
jgi:hypothetical protein